MATFLDKNKKKSALAALLLFIKTRKTVTALLLLVALASFLFVSPSNILLSFPGGTRVAAGVAWIAGKVGVDTSKWGLAGGKRDYGDLVAAFSAAKNGGAKAGWGAFMGGSPADAIKTGGSSGSLDFVKGNAKDLEVAGGNGAKLPTPGSVQGVLNPDDAKNVADGEGVALSDKDVAGERAGLVKSAFAGGFANGSGFNGGGNAGGAGGLNAETLSGGAFAGAGFFSSGKGAASGKLGDVVSGGLEGIKGQTAKGVQIQGAAKGQLSASKASQINARTSKGLVGTHTISGQRAFVQLAAGRGRAAISVSPNCTPGSGCPGEFASTNTGAVYDGNTITGDRTDILTAPEIDGISSPNLPDSGMADDYVKQAEKMDADAKKCRELDEKYGPQEQANDQRQEAISKEFESMGCGQGGCSKSKARKCQAMGDQMRAQCRATMAVRCAHIHACPLTANNNCSPAECDGPARDKTQIVEENGGICTRTMDGAAPTGQKCSSSTSSDEGDGSACNAGPAAISEAKTAALNALAKYRDANCEARLADTTLTGKASYAFTCSGPENNMIKQCNNYGYAICMNANHCESNGVCTGTSPECNVTNVSGIDAFLNK